MLHDGGGAAAAAARPDGIELCATSLVAEST